MEGFGAINVGRLTHMLSREVDAMCAARVGDCEISDQCAVTIASFYQSPGSVGLAFASLASLGVAELDELLDNIAWARGNDVPALSRDGQAAANLQLDMLATWAIDVARPVAGEIEH